MDPIDERLRAAMKALDDQVSDRYFEELPNKVLGRLEEKQMQSDVNRRSGSANPPLSVAPKAQDDDSTQQTRKVERQEDSGLHDMRALAQTTKQRMSQRRVPTQNPPVDDAALRASHASLRAIALPDPDKMVSVDEPVTVGSGTGSAPALLDRGASSTAAPATATARAPITPIKQRSKAPLVVASSVVALAAAGVVGFVVLKKDKSAQDKAPAAAMEDRAAPGSMTVTPAAPPPADEEAAKAPAPAAFQATSGAAPGGDVNAAAGAINGVGGGAADEAENTTDGDAKEQNAATKSDRADKHSGSGKTEDKKKKDDKGNKDSSGKSGDSADGAKDTDTTPVSTNETKKGPADKQEQSLDDLLRSAGVDPNAPKKTEGPKLDKKGLDAGDIRKAMSARTSKAQACYAKYSVSGSVGVKLQVANDGSVKSAKATGSFAGTPTGDCVADAASGAKFPAWDGNPTTVEYSYFLSE